MQSVDGDTAQVPPQIAEEMGISCIAYATDCAFQKRAIRIHTNNKRRKPDRYRRKRLPVVITVAKYEYPLFASFSATRLANKTKVIHLGGCRISTRR